LAIQGLKWSQVNRQELPAERAYWPVSACRGIACQKPHVGMRNEDVIDLYGRVPVGAKVVVL
jgi:hypothetical protein